MPKDAGARALGADAVAAALRAGGAEVVRTGSRGLYWLEPMVEIADAGGRIAYGPVRPADVAALLADPEAHPRRLGRPENIPFLARQTRLVFARSGAVDPASLDDYRAHGGLRGLARVFEIGPQSVIEAVTRSGLRGRGGAGFPTGLKWRGAAEAAGGRRHVVVNADEGDSGTFSDRMLMEGDPFALIEGMLIAGFAIGASHGWVYTRSEYPDAIAAFEAALAAARAGGLLGADVLGSGFAFEIEQRVGAGAYVCGEETSLLESLEGKRGQVRAKPPLPVHKGLFGEPTVINNVITLGSVPPILADGAEAFAALGVGRSRGTMPIQLAGNVRFPGLFEAPFGLTLGELVDEIGGGTASGKSLRAVQAGGPLGAYFPRSLFDTIYDYEAFTARDGLIGHGGLVVFDESVDMARQARFAMEFCAAEFLRQMHPVSRRLGARDGGDGPHPGRARRGRQSRADPGSLRDAQIRLAVRVGRVHSLPCHQRDHAFSRGFQRRPLCRADRRSGPGCRRRGRPCCCAGVMIHEVPREGDCPEFAAICACSSGATAQSWLW